jgi:hypothetical protein
MSRYNLINSGLGWITFVIALITYTLTLEPTVSFWDCGEFISASYRLQICHPPGAPLFLIIGRLFSLMAGDDVTKVAFWVNMVSATTSALCVMFYFWTITHLAKKILVKGIEELNMQQTVAVMASGLVGALALTWSDTFWFSAVEAEVYASSSFFTALTFWCILKWENVANEKNSERWLILIAYLIGLAIGVHLLNLLVIPAIVYVYYFKKYTFTKIGFIKATGVAFAAIAVVQFGIIPGLPELMAKFDFFFKNTLGMGFNTGIYAFIIILFVLIGFALHYTHTESKSSLTVAVFAYAALVIGSMMLNASAKGLVVWVIITGILYYVVFMMNSVNVRAYLNTVVLCIAYIIIGYSSYSMIMIRSAANPPIDMNDPEHPFTLVSYINREQYGDNPLVYGQYFYAKVIDIEKGPMQYRKGTDKYEETGPKLSRVYDPKDCTVLPRMWADREDYVQAYRNWEKIPEGKKATFGKNMDFMFSYQLGFMYWRYFMWNFAGRQNDNQGFGGVTDGNWISGIKFIDENVPFPGRLAGLGPQDGMPESMNNKARNTYFLLPLILGLIGMFYHFKKSKEDATVILTLFLFTGAFIVLYLNFPAHQPRERDYAYVGSFQTFMIWIGLGVLGIIDFLSKKVNRVAATGVVSIASLGVPLLMASQNWDDHDRSNRYTAVDFASNYLESCPKNAILFTNGDNDTYPLWYAQNVEGIRSDVRVINLSLLNTDWYADGLKRQAYESAPVPFSMTPDKYVQGVRDVVYYYQNPQVERTYGINQNDFYPLKNIINFINDDKDPLAKIQSQGGESYSYYPTKKFFVPVNKELALKNGAVHPKDAAFIADSIKFEVGRNNLMKADLIVLDIVANTDWSRPICFAITTGSDVYLNMQNYFQINGLVYQLVPILNSGPNDGSMGRLNTDIMYDNLINKFKWGGMDQPGVYLDETILRQTKNLRNLFYRLAIRLVEEGNNEKAIKVLDKALAVMPKENVPYDIFVVRLAEAYYAAGAVEKANALITEISGIASEKYRYFASFRKAGKGGLVQSDLQENEQIMGYCMQIAEMNKQDALAKDLKGKLDQALITQ